MIEWREAMSVDKAFIDHDHKKLIELVNRFESRDGIIEEIMIELIEYAQAHFSREEMLMREVRYPYLDAHRRAHQGLIRELQALLKRWEETPSSAHAAIIAELGDFLRRWLIGHIIKEDLQIKPFIAAARRIST